MLASSEVVTVIGYGPWDKDNEKYGEWVRVKADADQETRRYSLDKSINGGRPAEGERVTLTLLSRIKATAYIDGQGKAQNGSKEAWKCMGFTPAKAA